MLLALEPSPWIKALLAVVILLAITALEFSRLPEYLVWLAAPLLLAYGVWLWRNHPALRGPGEPLLWRPDGAWLGTLSGRAWSMTSHWYRGRHLVVIVLEGQDGRLPLLITPDCCDRTTFRRLRVRLRLLGNATPQAVTDSAS